MNKTQIDTLIGLDLFKELGLNNLSAEQKIALGDEMIKTVWQMILVRILESLNDEQKDKLYEFINSSKPEEVNAYINTLIPNYNDIVKEEIAKYKNMLIGSIDTIKR